MSSVLDAFPTSPVFTLTLLKRYMALPHTMHVPRMPPRGPEELAEKREGLIILRMMLRDCRVHMKPLPAEHIGISEFKEAIQELSAECEEFFEETQAQLEEYRRDMIKRNPHLGLENEQIGFKRTDNPRFSKKKLCVLNILDSTGKSMFLPIDDLYDTDKPFEIGDPITKLEREKLVQTMNGAGICFKDGTDALHIDLDIHGEKAMTRKQIQSSAILSKGFSSHKTFKHLEEFYKLLDTNLLQMKVTRKTDDLPAQAGGEASGRPKASTKTCPT